MKRILIYILSLVLLTAVTAPAFALLYEADAPKPVYTEAYTAALADYEVTQALRLGFVPEKIQADTKKTISRADAAELVLSFIAMQYGYDVGNFLELCGTSAVVLSDGSRPEYIPYRFKDLNGHIAGYVNWAAALGLMTGDSESTFNPFGSLTQQEAAVILRRTAEFYGAISKNSGVANTYTGKNAVESWALDSVNCLLSLKVLDSEFDPTVSCTGNWILTAYWRLYANAPVSREKGNTARLLSYEDELNRILKKDGVTINKQVELGAGTVVYYAFYGTNKLDVVYRDGGCKALPMPDETLIYLSASSGFYNILYVADRNGLRYEINVCTLTCTPVVPPNELSAKVLQEGERTLDASGSKNQFGRPAQDEKLLNGYAKPHIINIGYMPVYTDKGKEWTLSKDDMAVIRMDAERMQQYPAGQLIEFGYILGGQAIPLGESYLRDSASFTLRAPQDGNYSFYIINKSLNSVYMRSLSVEILHLYKRS